jgi:tetratricopeptide (TPR) repeat protein
LNDKAGIAKSYICIGSIYTTNKNHSEAISYYSKALALAKEIGIANEIRESARLLYKSYKVTGNRDLALSMYELATEMRDSIEKMDYKKEIFRQEFKFIYDKKAEADSIKSNQAKVIAAAKIAAQNAQLEKRQAQLYYLIFGAFILLTFVFIMYNRFKITKRQKLIIEKQKHLVVEQNKEILDSINYAKRIQSAYLPDERIFHFQRIENEFFHRSWKFFFRYLFNN